MTADLRRAATYGEPVFAGPGPGPLWRHACGKIVGVDLLANDGPAMPWTSACPGCDCLTPSCGDWRPLLAYTGPLCDQCRGNGWVPISGRVGGAACGFDTVTKCTACGATGMASEAQVTT